MSACSRSSCSASRSPECSACCCGSPAERGELASASDRARFGGPGGGDALPTEPAVTGEPATAGRACRRSPGALRSPRRGERAGVLPVLRAAGGGEPGELLDALLGELAHGALDLPDVALGGVRGCTDLDADLDRVGQRAREPARLLEGRHRPGAAADLVDVRLAGVLGALDLGGRQRRSACAGRGRWVRLLLAGRAQRERGEPVRPAHAASTRASTTEMLSMPPSSLAAATRRST